MQSSAALFLRYRSGNPGYVVGLPILFGSVQGNVVNMSDQGLLVPSLAITTGVAAASDDCLTGENLITAALKFGHDMFSGCASSFNRWLSFHIYLIDILTHLRIC